MATGKYLVRTSCVLIIGTLFGCANENPFARQATIPASYSADGNSLVSSGTTMADPYSRATPPSMTSRIGNSITGGVQTVSDGIRDTFDVQPRVVAAEDPASLASMPNHLDPMLYIQAAAFSEQSGKPDAAYQQFQHAMEMAPRNVEVMIAYARFVDRQGSIDTALGTYRYANSIEPRNAIVLNDMGLCYARTEQTQPALDCLHRAVTLQPGNERYRNNLSNILVGVGNIEAAVANLQEVYPPAVANYNVGYMLHAQGRSNEAENALVRAVQLDPSMEASRVLLARVHQSRRGSTSPTQTATQPSVAAGRYNTAPASAPPAYPRQQGQAWESTPESSSDRWAREPYGNEPAVASAPLYESASRTRHLPPVR